MPYVFRETQVGEPLPASDFPSLTSEVLTETFAQTFEENPVAAMARAKELADDHRSGEMLDAETARQRLADRGMENDLKISDAGISKAALDTLMFRKGVEKRRQEVYGQAEGGLAQGAARIGVSLATSLIDPIGVATAFIPIVGEARYLGWLGRSGGVLSRTGVRASVGALEGAVGSAMLEPIIAGSRRYEQADYDMADSLLNVAFGGLFGAGLHSTFGAVSDGITHYRGAEPAWRGLDKLSPADSQLVLSLRAEIERGMDARDIARATEGWSTEARRAVEPVLPQRTPAEAAHEALPPQVRENALRQAIVQAVTDEPVNVAHIVESYRSGPVVGYTTAKGSTYEIAPDGSTTRNKAARPEHPGEFGPQPRSERTFYVSPADAQRLGEFQAQGGARRSVSETAAGRIGVRYESGPHAGKFEKRTVVTAQREPTVGAIPVEIWDGGRRVHFGNEITSLFTGAKPVQAPRTVLHESFADVAKASAYAEKVLARETDTGTATADALKNATEEASLAQSDLQALAGKLGQEAEDAELRSVLDAAANADRWARAAELATVCLVRGG